MGLFSADKAKPYKPKSVSTGYYPEVSDKWTSPDKQRPIAPKVSIAIPILPEQRILDECKGLPILARIQKGE